MMYTTPDITRIISVKAGNQGKKRRILPVLLFLLLPLFLPLSCSCFPDQSPAIGKERDWDKKNVELQEEMNKHRKAVHERLKAFQQKLPDLDEKKLFQGNDMKIFLETMYTPFLSTLKAIEEHQAKHEKDRTKKAEHIKSAGAASGYLYWLTKWIQENDTKSMYGLILSAMKQAQEGALHEALRKLQKESSGLDKDKLFQLHKELVEQRYIPYLYVVKVHGLHFAIHGQDNEKDDCNQNATKASESLQKVTKSLQENDKDEIHDCVKDLTNEKVK